MIGGHINKSIEQTKLLDKLNNRSFLLPVQSKSQKIEASDRWADNELERRRRDDALRQEQRQQGLLRREATGPMHKVLGQSSKGGGNNRFIFEDNDGEQTKREHDIDETIGHLETSVRNIHLQATALSGGLAQSNRRLAEMSETVSARSAEIMCPASN